MSEKVQIALIVAAALLIIIFVLRKVLSRFLFKAGNGAIEAEIETHNPAAKSSRPPGVNISGNRQFGKGNVIEVGRDDVNVERNTQLGEDQKIVARSDKKPKKR